MAPVDRNCFLIGLKKAYHQVAIRSDQRVYQDIRWKGKLLADKNALCSPQIMTDIVQKNFQLISLSNSVSNYIDDFVIHENRVFCTEVINHLKKIGLLLGAKKMKLGARAGAGMKIDENFLWSLECLTKDKG